VSDTSKLQHLHRAAARGPILTFANGSRWEYRRRTAAGMIALHAVDDRGLYAGASLTLPLEDLATRLAGQDCSSSPLAALPPAIRATFTPAQRLELANYCGPDTARTVPMDTGREHGPCAVRVRHHTTSRRGWLVASSDAGRYSLVLWRSATSERARTSWHPTTATRLGWSA
jgi:hypothetical protein